jgi:hypothetical protein
LKTELKRIFERGLLLSSYNIYSQPRPWQMETSILELVALEIAYHAGGLINYETTKKWTELIWDVDGLKRILAEDKLHAQQPDVPQISGRARATGRNCPT